MPDDLIISPDDLIITSGEINPRYHHLIAGLQKERTIQPNLRKDRRNKLKSTSFIKIYHIWTLVFILAQDHNIIVSERRLWGILVNLRPTWWKSCGRNRVLKWRIATPRVSSWTQMDMAQVTWQSRRQTRNCINYIVSCRHRSCCGLYHLFQNKVDNAWVICTILQISLMLMVIIDKRLKDWKRNYSKRQYTLPLLWYIYFIQHLGTENVFMCDLLRFLWRNGNDAKGGETN